MSDLTQRHCVPCEGGVPPLNAAQTEERRAQLNTRWRVTEEGKALEADFQFNNYFRTLAFVNAVAYLAVKEDHHPDLSFGYNTLHVRYSTHAIGGLSDNDFICAAKIDAL